MKKTSGIKSAVVTMFLFLSFTVFSQSDCKFVIILDAGHGGKDPGNSYHGFVEKKIALETTLKLEKYLKKDPDIQIVYTRKKDVFVKLEDRPNIANKADANLFVSIHCNSVKNPEPFGTETFVMGLARSETNLEIAKNENSVILLEKDYKETYKGFDPKNPETLIGLKILQEEYLNRSISLASKIENNFTKKLNRKSRGIKQTPLWVLDAAYMPSVLVELGFLSNSEEGLYLNSEVGQNKMAEAIADAIISYKKEYFGDGANGNNEGKVSEPIVRNQVRDIAEIAKSEPVTVTVPAAEPVEKPVVEPVAEKQLIKEQVPEKATPEVIFKVQIAALQKNIKLTPANFKGLDNVSVTTDNGTLYKYAYGCTADYNDAKKNLEVAKAKGYTSAFLIAFKDGKKINIQEAIK